MGKFAMRANSGIARHTLFFVQQRKKILSSIAFDVKAVFFFSVYFFLGISSERLWRGMKKMPCWSLSLPQPSSSSRVVLESVAAAAKAALAARGEIEERKKKKLLFFKGNEVV